MIRYIMVFLVRIIFAMHDYLLNYMKHVVCRSMVTIGSHSKFYKESNVYNLQNRKDKIVIGSNTHIRGELMIYPHGGNIQIGDYSYVSVNTRIWSLKKIKIGDRVLIAHNCNIFDNDTHPFSAEVRHRQHMQIITSGHPRDINLNERGVVIEDDAWIGANSIIFKGVTIGKGAIVSAGSVVRKNVPPYTVVAGNPAVAVSPEGILDRPE